MVSGQRNTTCAKVKAFWVKLLRDGRAPQKHSKAPSDIKDEYIFLMEDSFPWFHYCKNHWKSKQIWHSHYPPWYGNVQRKAKVAAEKEAAEKTATEGKFIDVGAGSNNI